MALMKTVGGATRQIASIRTSLGQAAVQAALKSLQYQFGGLAEVVAEQKFALVMVLFDFLIRVHTS